MEFSIPLFLKVLIILLFIIILIGIYILVYYFNQKTNIPKGINLEELNNCSSCDNFLNCNKNNNQKECESKNEK